MEQKEKENKAGTASRAVPAESIARQIAGRLKMQASGEKRPGGTLLVVGDKPPVSDNTTVMLHLINDAAVIGHMPTAFFSPDMSNVDAVNRLIAITTGIDYETIADGTLSKEQWATLDKRLPNLLGSPVYVDDTPSPTVSQLREKITALATDKGVRLVIVNSINLIAVDGFPLAACGSGSTMSPES